MDNDIKRLNSREMREVILAIMDSIDKWCSENGVVYYLYYGTLLGAIRHEGFIPWDDDFDIAIPRKDYEKFIRRFNSDSNRYRVIGYHNTKGYYLPFAKVIDTYTILKEEVRNSIEIGVYIDIFPLDNLGNDLRSAKKLERQTNFYIDLFRSKLQPFNSRRSHFRNLLARMVSFIPLSVDNLIIKVDKMACSKGLTANNQYVGVLVDKSVDSIMLSEWFNYSHRVNFEGHLFAVPNGYDSILTHLYGDYMQMPPEDQRQGTHDFEAFVQKGFNLN